MTWRLAGSLLTLREQCNRTAPQRSKVSDGAVGDTRHQAKGKASDHNPDPNGVVCAIDITHDPAGGLDAYNLAEALRVMLGADKRLHYVISNRKIATAGIQKGAWRPYKGLPHDHHTHVSVYHPLKLADDKTPWDIGKRGPAASLPVPPPVSKPAMAMPQLKYGANGDAVRTLQSVLQAQGFYKDAIDGAFGAKTRTAVKAYQTAHGLSADGIVGGNTWSALDIGTPPQPQPAPVTDAEVWYSAPYPTPDAYGLEWGKTLEHFEADAYPDPTPKAAAQGYGHNATSGLLPIPVIGGPTWSEEYAATVYAADVAISTRYINYYCQVPLTQAQINALVLDIFKLGPGNWRKDKVRELLNAGDYAGAFLALRNRRTDIPGVKRRYDILARIGEGAKPSPSEW